MWKLKLNFGGFFLAIPVAFSSFFLFLLKHDVKNSYRLTYSPPNNKRPTLKHLRKEWRAVSQDNLRKIQHSGIFESNKKILLRGDFKFLHTVNILFASIYFSKLTVCFVCIFVGNWVASIVFVMPECSPQHQTSNLFTYSCKTRLTFDK